MACSVCGLEFRFLCALAVELHVETCRPSSPAHESSEIFELKSSCANEDETIVDLTSPSCASICVTGQLNPDTRDSCSENTSPKVRSLGETLWSRLETRLMSCETPAIKPVKPVECSALSFDKCGPSATTLCHPHDDVTSMVTKNSNVTARTKSVGKRAPLQPYVGNVPRPNRDIPQVYVQKRPRNVVAPNAECSVPCTNPTSDCISRMPDYSSMEVDELKTLLRAYGVRPGQKRYMVDKLSEIWLRLQVASSSSQTQDPDARNSQAEAERAEMKKRDRRAQQEERDKRTLVATVEALRSHIVLYERILLMESLSLDEVADALAEEGVRISMRLLGHLLDELGVPWTHGPPRCNKPSNAALATLQEL